MSKEKNAAKTVSKGSVQTKTECDNKTLAGKDDHSASPSELTESQHSGDNGNITKTCKEIVQTEIKIPQKILQALEKKEKGILSLKQKLEDEHFVKVKYDGNSLKLAGQHEDILDMAVDMVYKRSGESIPEQTKSLGLKGTVVWTFEREKAVILSTIFKDELNQLEDNDLAHVKTNLVTKLTCSYENYPQVKEKMDKIEDNMKIVLEIKTKEKVSLNHQAYAKKFSGTHHTAFCCLYDDQLSHLVFYATDKDNIEIGLNSWSVFCNTGKDETSNQVAVEVKGQFTEQKPDSETFSVVEGSMSKEENAAKTVSKGSVQTKSEGDNKTHAGEDDHSASPSELRESQQSGDGSKITKTSKVMDADWNDQGPDESAQTKPSTVKSDGNLKTKRETAEGNLKSTVSTADNKLKMTCDTGDEMLKRTGKLVDDQLKTTNSTTSVTTKYKEKKGDKPGALELIKTGGNASSKEKKLGDKNGTMPVTGENQKYTFDCSGMKVYVYKASIVSLDCVDAITNAANEGMMHGAGVAYYISKAAGDLMNQDCNAYIKKHGVIPTTENYVSIPGKIKGCKGIIHAVGPVWCEYPQKEKCAEDLHKTIINALEAAKKKTWKSVALPAISSGLYGVPKQLCAEMYVKAFADFGRRHGSVADVHFVDVSQEILDMVIAACEKWLKDPKALSFRNALQYPTAAATLKTWRMSEVEKSSDSGDPLIVFEGEERTTYKARVFKYKVLGKMPLYVYNGDLLRLKTVDAIVVPLLPGLTGGALAEEVRKIGGQVYLKELDKHRTKREGDVFVCTSQGRKIIHVIYTPISETSQKSLAAFCRAYRSVLTADYNRSIQKIAMPLFGTTQLRDHRDIEKLCQQLLSQIIDTLSGTPGISLKELHFVNLSPNVTDVLQNELKIYTLANTRRLSRGETRQHGVTVQGRKERYDFTRESRYMKENKGWTEHKTTKDPDSKKMSKQTLTADKKKAAQAEKLESSATLNKNCPFHKDKEGKFELNCGKHAVCSICQSMVSDCKECEAQDQNDQCPICQDTITNPASLPCGHKMCKECFAQLKKHKPACPVCGYHFDIVTGNQPPGTMLYRTDSGLKLPGYEKYGAIIIKYMIPDGRQTKDHPHKGRKYGGISRLAFLPHNEEGKEVLDLFRRAFDRKLIFTIGESRTTGKEDVVTWNDIHHKTAIGGGPENFGYPDPSYLSRVKEELAAKGVVN